MPYVHDADRWCTRCGGGGLVSYANPGEKDVWEACPTCHGSQYEQWRAARLAKAREKAARYEYPVEAAE